MSEMLRYIGCACVVPDGNGRYLMVRETKAVARGRMAMPGGMLEPDESIVDAAVREVFEETGLTVEATRLLGIFHCPHTSEDSYGVNFVYEGRPVAGEVTTSEEHPEVVWLTLAEIEDLHARGLVRGGHVQIAVRRSEQNDPVPNDVVTQVEASD